MGRRQQDSRRQTPPPREVRKRPAESGGEKEEQHVKTRCPHCGIGRLRFRGSVGSAGHMRWKCRDCGRTVWERKEITSPPEPVVPVPLQLL